jgi:hypothetical protein
VITFIPSLCPRFHFFVFLFFESFVKFSLVITVNYQIITMKFQIVFGLAVASLALAAPVPEAEPEAAGTGITLHISSSRLTMIISKISMRL